MSDLALHEIVCDSRDREAWLEARRTGIGASEAAGVLGVSPWQSPLSVFAAKVLGGEEDRDSEQMEWGRIMEPVILAHYSRATGREVTPAGFLLRSRAQPYMLATLDGMQVVEGRASAVEVKTSRYPWKDGIPEHYWVQVQHQLSVTGLTHGTVAVLAGGSEFRWADVERDEHFISAILRPTLCAFWMRVEAGGPPPATDASQATREALARIYPASHGRTVSLDGAMIDLDMERQRLASERRRIEREILGIDNALKAEMKDAEIGILPNGRRYTWRANKNGVRVFRAPTDTYDEE